MSTASNLAQSVQSILEGLDSQTEVFAQATGLACPTGCGRCCTTPAVETSALEMLPMALELWRRAELPRWLARGRAEGEKGLCLAYEHDPDDPDRGRCSMYRWRPSLCRLYGFAGRRNKYGESEHVACPVHEEHDPESTLRAQELVAAGHPLLLFTTPTLRIRGLEPGLGSERQAIRPALLRALEYVGLATQLAELPTPEGTQPAAPTAPAEDRGNA